MKIHNKRRGRNQSWLRLRFSTNVVGEEVSLGLVVQKKEKQMKEETFKCSESKRETMKVRLLMAISRSRSSHKASSLRFDCPDLCQPKHVCSWKLLLSHNSFYRVRESFPLKDEQYLRIPACFPSAREPVSNPPSSNNRCVDESCRSSGGDGRRRVGSRSQSGGSASLHDRSDCLWFPPEKAKAPC